MERPFQSQKKSGSYIRALLLLFALYFAGFTAYALSLPKIDNFADTRLQADGIVALTGGDSRLMAAVSLLERGVAKRLLISGVHPQTTKDELKGPLHGGSRFDCCVDLGMDATDTRGNAIETARWAREHNYKSLIIVTAAYHMPRSLLEFANEMPNVKLIPYPVETAPTQLSGEWNLESLRILNGEYVKLAASLVRVTFEHAIENRTTSEPHTKSAQR